MKRNQYHIEELFQKYRMETLKNHRRKPDGTNLSQGTKRNIEVLFSILIEFREHSNYNFIITLYLTNNKRTFKQLSNRYALFYKKFTDYLFDERDMTDNSVGSHIKNLKCFFRWLNEEHGLITGPFYKRFFVWREDIPIVVLNEAQLRYLIFDNAFHESLSPKLQRAKDIFVFGCTVGLRVGDLLNLKKSNIQYSQEGIHVVNISAKSGTRTTIKLPEYAENILKRRWTKSTRLFRPMGAGNLNKYIKEICQLADFTHIVEKTRKKRGKAIVIRRADGKETRFCDLVSTHTMRRTAITTLLNLGVEEEYVRKISGHAPASKEFYKYVKYNQQKIDHAIGSAFEKLAEKQP